MYVIENHNQVKPWKEEKICINCTSRLLVEEEDLTHVPDIYEGTDVGRVHFTCPCCSFDNEIRNTYLPEEVADRIKNR